MHIYSIVCHADSCVYTEIFNSHTIGTYKPFAVSAPKIELREPGIYGIINVVNDKTKMWNWQQVLEL